jgi:hypothetical protein
MAADSTSSASSVYPDLAAAGPGDWRTFPPYHLLDPGPRGRGSSGGSSGGGGPDGSADGDPLLDDAIRAAAEKTRKLERLYHQTQAHAWDPRAVLDELEAKHGGIHLDPAKREALGQVFSAILWGELAAWNIAADLARWLPDLDARMAATGQTFDEARHFTVLRDYLNRAGIQVPPVSPFARRLFRRLLATDSIAEKLNGMQLLVENLALAIFKQVAASKIEPVLTDLLTYIERDEARHVALGILYLPRLLRRMSRLERARNRLFSMELFLLSVAGGQYLDRHFQTLGLDHRELGVSVGRVHQHMMRQMVEEEGLKAGERIPGLYGLSARQHDWLVDFLHPADPQAGAPAMKRARRLFAVAVQAAARLMN